MAKTVKDGSDLIVYQDWTKTAGSTVSNNNESEVKPIDKNYDPFIDLNADYLANMDMNKPISWANQSFNEYWDDSSPDKQSTKWWLNEKYTGEYVKNSDVNYNPDITTKDLNPNFVYGQASKVYGTDHPWYISRRNDEIASALFNEWKLSREEVAEFLQSQNWFYNSSEADRANTIEAVWKRIGDLAKEQPDLSKAEDIVQDTSGKIYWKTTAEEWNPKEWIDTLSDANSVLRAMQEWDVVKLQNFVSQDPRNIAVCLNEWTITWDEQTWRNAEKYYPEFIAEVKAEQKKQIAQKNVQAIASGEEMTTTAANGQSNANTGIANFWVNNATWTKSSVEITKDVHDSLAQNQTANEASETMASIEEDMAILKNRLKNLRQEANSKFKWDAPEYMVNAYISNKTQEIQNQMQILEDRYNAAYNRYKTEIAQTQWEKEYQLKQDQLELQRDEYKLKKWATEQGIEIDKAKLKADTNKAAKNEWDSFDVTTLSDEEISQKVDELYSMFDNWQLGNAQCAAWIQTYYLPMLWITLPSLSTLERKKALINEDENYVPKRWDLIIINSGAKLEDWTPAWHIGIVLGVHKDWTVEYMDWNGKSDEKAAISGININSKSILWFRNVNKWQVKISNEWWTDQDYINFNNFLDTDNKDISNTDRASIAEMYWFKDNLPWMTAFATNALANRPEKETSEEFVIPNIPEWSTVSTNAQWRVVITPPEWEPIVYWYWVTENDPRLLEAWFDPVLWYNTKLRDTYEEILKAWFKSKWVLSEYAEAHGRTADQIWQEARNYQVAKDNWTDLYSDVRRKVTRDYWFAVGKADVYNRLDEALSKTWQIDWKKWENFVAELWIGWPLEKAIEIATDELANFKEYQWETLEEYWNILRDLEFIIMQDANYIQRQNIMDSMLEDWTIDVWDLRWEWADWAVAYNHLKATEVFNQLANAKQWWVSLYPVSDADMKMVKDAATPINWAATDYSFKQAINDKYKVLREKVWMPITDEQLDEMWGKEWNTLQELWGLIWLYNPNFSDYITIDHARYSWLFRWWNYWYKKNKEDKISDDAARYREIEEWNSNEGSQSFSDMASSRAKNK